MLRFQYNWVFTLGITRWGIFSAKSGYFYYAIHKRIKDVNPNGEFILMRNGEQLTTITFNRHLKAYCDSVGIEPRTSHKIRFTVASLLYKNGVPATTLQRLLGHSTLAMTLHYLRDITPEEDTFNAMKAVLG